MPLPRHLTISLILATLLIAAITAVHHYRTRAHSLEQQLATRTAHTGTDTERRSENDAKEIAIETIHKSLFTDNETLTDYTNRIQELETALAERDAEIGRLQRMPLAATPTATAEAPRERRNWLENLRDQDPERYTEIQTRRTEAQQQMRDSLARKAAHFLYRDTAAMDEGERAEYEHMLGLLGETWQLAEQIQGADLSRDERGEMGRAMMQNMRTLTPMLEAERDREFHQLAQHLGYDDQRAGQFVDYINDIIEVSTFGSILRGPRRGWGRD